ncbi:hypothetical protein RFI_35324 [Reticulomyxa filosa]|uniref:Uncharacterized protein n=1 Tax=Reticulomyxa filosa TaxID=46433 RepID=X6LJI0_RETFI|nr:hypothetical protein RFI_35324 [Reticulomyxa filosa]|eukprot:ETO02108.1 hypothetical protein RFI_35324 [Reticulomyxa filosa]
MSEIFIPISNANTRNDTEIAGGSINMDTGRVTMRFNAFSETGVIRPGDNDLDVTTSPNKFNKIIKDHPELLDEEIAIEFCTNMLSLVWVKQLNETETTILLNVQPSIVRNIEEYEKEKIEVIKANDRYEKILSASGDKDFFSCVSTQTFNLPLKERGMEANSSPLKECGTQGMIINQELKKMFQKRISLQLALFENSTCGVLLFFLYLRFMMSLYFKLQMSCVEATPEIMYVQLINTFYKNAFFDNETMKIK